MVCRLQDERDLAEKEARDKETKILSLTRELEEMEDQMTDMQRKYMGQKREYEEIVSSKDDVGKSVHDLEKVGICYWEDRGVDYDDGFDLVCCTITDWNRARLTTL